MNKNLLLATFVILLPACQTVITEIEAPVETVAGNVSHSPISAVTTPDTKISTHLPIVIENADVEVGYSDLWERIESGFQLQEFYNHESVASPLNNYSNNQRYFDIVAERATPFLFWIVDEIDRRGLPQEIALLPFVESTFNPNAYSKEHAVGLWQFVGATGTSFGLQLDWWYDGRRDPFASTMAALDYLEELYQQFDEDWLLALAAYNTGDGNVRRAIRRSGLEEPDFFSLPLARETRSHIPKLLALAKLLNEGDHFGIELPGISNSPGLESVRVGAQIDLAQAADLAGLEYQQIRSLNPGYLQWATHPDYPQSLWLPPENAAQFSTKLLNFDTEKLLSWDHYEIMAGDTLGAIALNLGTRVDVLQTVNDIDGSRIVAGDSLLIPRGQSSSQLSNLPTSPIAARPIATPPDRYTVRRGDNLWSIARRFDLKSTEIVNWNQISLDSLLQPGQVLDFRFANTETIDSLLSESHTMYNVRRGDSMDRISRRVSVSLDELLLWNEMKATQVIYPGQIIRIVPPESGIN